MSNSHSSCFQLRQVRKSYGDSFTLLIEQLDIPAGQVLGLLGPTGAGKSTLLRLLAGMESPTAGEVQFKGRCHGTDDWPLAVRRHITLVFQRPLLLSESVRANVEYGLRLRGCADRSGEKATRWLARLGLQRLESQVARTLSGGQTQLVALARALVIEPDVLLLDEPTAHLDPAHVALVEDVIAEDHRQRGTTVVWATHNLFQARRVADRVSLLWNGQVVEVAPTAEFFESPSDPRTADFVQGKMVY